MILQLNEEEAKAFIQIADLACKSEGLGVAPAAVHLAIKVQKLLEAEEEKDGEEVDD